MKNSQRRDCFELYARKCAVTELSGWLDPNTQIPSISILDEIRLICKQPQVNSFSCACLSSHRLPWRDQYQYEKPGFHSEQTTPAPFPEYKSHHISSPHYRSRLHALRGEAASAERSIWGPNQERLPFSGVQTRGGKGNCMQSWDEDLVNIPITSKLPSLRFASLLGRLDCFSPEANRRTERQQVWSTHSTQNDVNIVSHAVLINQFGAEELQAECAQLSGWPDSWRMEKANSPTECPLHLLANCNN